MIDNLSIAVHTFFSCMLTSVSVKEVLFPCCVNWYTNCIGLPLIVEISTFHLKLMNFVLFAFR